MDWVTLDWINVLCLGAAVVQSFLAVIMWYFAWKKMRLARQVPENHPNPYLRGSIRLSAAETTLFGAMTLCNAVQLVSFVMYRMSHM